MIIILIKSQLNYRIIVIKKQANIINTRIQK
jgi:hypothetical protein